jgi:hypothetical protein
MFLCCNRKLFCAKIEIKNNFINDDQKVFKKMHESYGKARGLLGNLSLVYSLTSIWKRDILAGFTLAAIAAVPMSTLSLLITLWKD